MDGETPRPLKDTSISRFNSLRTGLRSALCVLPWESVDEYAALCRALVDHHNPVGPVEAHLVEEVAGAIWRMQRVQRAEAALYRKDLAKEASHEYSGGEVLRAALIGTDANPPAGPFPLGELVGPPGEQPHLAGAARDLGRVMQVADNLRAGGDYAKAEAALGPEWREDWASYIGETVEYGGETEYTYQATGEALLYYLDHELIPLLRKQDLQYRYKEPIAEQLRGQAFNPGKLEIIGRYETHLDRKLERSLAMLIKLQQLRQQAGTP